MKSSSLVDALPAQREGWVTLDSIFTPCSRCRPASGSTTDIECLFRLLDFVSDLYPIFHLLFIFSCLKAFSYCVDCFVLAAGSPEHARYGSSARTWPVAAVPLKTKQRGMLEPCESVELAEKALAEHRPCIPKPSAGDKPLDTIATTPNPYTIYEAYSRWVGQNSIFI